MHQTLGAKATSRSGKLFSPTPVKKDGVASQNIKGGSSLCARSFYFTRLSSYRNKRTLAKLCLNSDRNGVYSRSAPNQYHETRGPKSRGSKTPTLPEPRPSKYHARYDRNPT